MLKLNTELKAIADRYVFYQLLMTAQYQEKDSNDKTNVLNKLYGPSFFATSMLLQIMYMMNNAELIILAFVLTVPVSSSNSSSNMVRVAGLNGR